MNKFICVLFSIAILLTGTICFAAPVVPSGGLIPPPAIYIPYGGTITTEINFSDNDVLGIAKQLITATAETADDMFVAAKQRQEPPSEVVSILSSLNLATLAEAVNGVKGVRVIVAKYTTNITPSEMMRQFTNGVAKAGNFTKVISDQTFIPGTAALFAQEGNSGYIGFAYDSKQRMLCAARIVGSVDVAKITEWAINAAGTLGDKIPIGKVAPMLNMPTDSATLSDQ
jgi:hypothetical protein